MTRAEYDAFAEALAGLAEVYRAELSPAAVAMYWRALGDWTLAEFREAAMHLLRTARWMPVPADFEALRRAGHDTAGEAWARVLAHVRHGTYRTAGGLDDGGPIDRAVHAIGGYRAIGFADATTTHHMERRFGAHYAEAVTMAETRHALPGVTRAARIRGPRSLASVMPAAAPTRREGSR